MLIGCYEQLKFCSFAKLTYLVAIQINSGFDVQDISEEAPDDEEGLDATVAHVVNLLSTEPTDSKFHSHVVCLSVVSSSIFRD